MLMIMRSRNDNIFITGPSGTGKSTMIQEIIRELDIKIEGISTPDIRKGGRRVGFKLVDLKTGEEGVLAHVDQKEGPKLSKYRVNLVDVEKFTKNSLEKISVETDLVVIDEIGTMELFSDRFEKAVLDLLKGRKPVLAVLHRNYTDEYSEFGKIYTLNRDNYSEIKEKIKIDLKEGIDLY